MHRNFVRVSSLFLAAMFVVLLAPGLTRTVVAQAGAALKSGQASGTFVANGKTYKLAYASAFVDGKDETRPIVLLLTDLPVPPKVLDRSITLSFAQNTGDKPFSGVVLRLNQRGLIMRADYYEKDDLTSTTGLFELKFDSPVGDTVIGSAHTTADAAKQTPPVKLDVAFNATVTP